MQIDTELYKRYQLLKSQLQDFKLDERIGTIEGQIKELENKTTDPNFWNNHEVAAKANSQLRNLKKELDDLNTANSGLNDLEFIYSELRSGKVDFLPEFSETITNTEKIYSKLRVQKYLSGKFDDTEAIFSIFAGQGGTEANDWADMLLRMYLRYFNKKGWITEIIDKTVGTETGISSVTLKVSGDWAYGYCKCEHGTHRLVRVSPFNAQGLRQTSFAGIEVTPVIKQTNEIDIKPHEIEFSAVRSGGAGGQNVNKVATSVRIRHIPTNIVVTSSAQRSQLQNKETALDMLRGKIALLEQESINNQITAASGEKFVASWGRQIRNYILQPYKLVKDLRTGVETDRVEDVLDGELDVFIEAAIAWLVENKQEH